MSERVREIQREHAEWQERNFGPDIDPYRPLLGAMEELGELAHAHLKEVDCIRGTPEELQAKAKDAIGDIVIYLSGYCSLRGWDLLDCLEEAWAEVRQRDWVRERLQARKRPTEWHHIYDGAYGRLNERLQIEVKLEGAIAKLQERRQDKENVVVTLAFGAMTLPCRRISTSREGRLKSTVIFLATGPVEITNEQPLDREWLDLLKSAPQGMVLKP